MTFARVLTLCCVVGLLVICNLQNCSVHAGCKFDGSPSTCRHWHRGCQSDEVRTNGACFRDSVCCAPREASPKQAALSQRSPRKTVETAVSRFHPAIFPKPKIERQLCHRNNGRCQFNCHPGENIHNFIDVAVCPIGQKCCVTGYTRPAPRVSSGRQFGGGSCQQGSPPGFCSHMCPHGAYIFRSGCSTGQSCCVRNFDSGSLGSISDFVIDG